MYTKEVKSTPSRSKVHQGGQKYTKEVKSTPRRGQSTLRKSKVH